MNLLVKNGTLVTGEEARKGDILISGEKIQDIKDRFREDEIPSGTEIIDAGGKYVFPGFIDAHTHFQLVSRGTVTADRFYDGSVLAAFGGITTVVDFADHLTGKRIAEGSLTRNREASGEMAIDWALHQVVTDVGAVILNNTRHSKAGYTPYNGMEVKGRVDVTILRGEVIMKEAVFTGRKGSGKFIAESGSSVV